MSGSPQAAPRAEASAVPSAPELPSPAPGGAPDRVWRREGSAPNERSAARCSGSSLASATPSTVGYSRVRPRSSATIVVHRGAGLTSTVTLRSIAAATTSPPSCMENGGTSVQPPARSSRTGAEAPAARVSSADSGWLAVISHARSRRGAEPEAPESLGHGRDLAGPQPPPVSAEPRQEPGAERRDEPRARWGACGDPPDPGKPPHPVDRKST